MFRVCVCGLDEWVGGGEGMGAHCKNWCVSLTHV